MKNFKQLLGLCLAYACINANVQAMEMGEVEADAREEAAAKKLAAEEKAAESAV